MRVISYILVFFNIHTINKFIKLSIYSDILEKYKKKLLWYGICSNLEDSLQEHNLPISFTQFKFWYFPELYLQKPLLVNFYKSNWWWKRTDTLSRIKALQKAILLIN